MSASDNPWAGTIAWLQRLLLNAFFQGTPAEGMRASAILFAITFASNFVGLLFTIVLDILFAGVFAINLLRYILSRFA